jgi:hypothetical protein
MYGRAPRSYIECDREGRPIASHGLTHVFHPLAFFRLNQPTSRAIWLVYGSMARPYRASRLLTILHGHPRVEGDVVGRGSGGGGARGRRGWGLGAAKVVRAGEDHADRYGHDQRYHHTRGGYGQPPPRAIPGLVASRRFLREGRRARGRSSVIARQGGGYSERLTPTKPCVSDSVWPSLLTLATKYSLEKVGILRTPPGMRKAATEPIPPESARSESLPSQDG